ncbi:putative sugar O-methyltransferase [Rhizobium sp. BK399]|uniref:putative sugar O-methyltransferase n=1 Tax=Rhizobium sp. BK399 TaxID=2587063 RepID=UPI00160EEC49|nr:putative sugar O-methyltransferase [Rhizobium sp. BK399]MBB3542447.1 hypothetical protein [Rhizobium sp. BK399]
MNPILKKTMMRIPAIGKYARHIRALSAGLESRDIELGRLRALIAGSRSPGLFDTAEDFLTERLTAHPIRNPLPSVALSSHGAVPDANRIKIAERLIDAYHKALADEHQSPLKRTSEDLWTGLLRQELPELMRTIDQRDPERLANFLMNFGQSYVWFGGITTCVDGYNRNLDPRHVALSYHDKMICLAEFLGVLRTENPESGPWGDNVYADIDSVVDAIEDELRIDIAPPLGIIHTEGLVTQKGLFHYRHINALYSAIKVSRLNPGKSAVCEFGGGLGLTAMYARRLGVLDYTILDLPITCLLAGHYLLQALGEEQVSLYGEDLRPGAVKLLPYWEILNVPSSSVEISVNQDSFPEISENLVLEYLTHIKRISTGYFLSINHECFHPHTVFNCARRSGGFELIDRSRCWVREGYVDEVYRTS